MHIYPPRDREHTLKAVTAFRTVRSECFELFGLGLVTLRLLTIPLPIRVVEETTVIQPSTCLNYSLYVFSMAEPDDPTVDDVASRVKARHASRKEAPDGAPAPQADPTAADDHLKDSGGDQTGADNASNIADSGSSDSDSGGINGPNLDAEASHERMADKLAEWYASLSIGSDERRDADAHFAGLGIQISQPSASG